MDDEGLSVTFNKVDPEAVETVTLKDVNGKITAEIEEVTSRINQIEPDWGMEAPYSFILSSLGSLSARQRPSGNIP